MVFIEILIPQDPFTETNVTRKRSVVRIHIYLKNIYFIFHKHYSFFFQDYLDITFIMTKDKYDTKYKY